MFHLRIPVIYLVTYQATAAKQCNYTYPFTTVREFVDFCQKVCPASLSLFARNATPYSFSQLTRFGEAGVYGFIEHLNSRASAELLVQSITTEARQQMIFRQFQGLFPMPVRTRLWARSSYTLNLGLQIWFLPGITQSMAWTLLSPYITSCPAENPHIVFQNFPALNITVGVFPPPF